MCILTNRANNKANKIETKQRSTMQCRTPGVPIDQVANIHTFARSTIIRKRNTMPNLWLWRSPVQNRLKVPSHVNLCGILLEWVLCWQWILLLCIIYQTYHWFPVVEYWYFRRMKKLSKLLKCHSDLSKLYFLRPTCECDHSEMSKFLFWIL